MTLVIGAKFRDGVILVADRKITDPNSPDDNFTLKLKEPYPNTPICFGASGYKNKYDQFNRKILQIASEHIRETELKNRALFRQNNLEYLETEEKEEEDKTLDKGDIESKPKEKESKTELFAVYSYTIENFLEDSQNLIRKLCTGQDGIIRPQLETLTIVFSNDEPRLHHLDFDGSEQEVDFSTIGSGANYVDLFLRKFWNKDMGIEAILKLAYFCIYYVQDLKFDTGVGVEEGVLPDNRVVTHGEEFGRFNGFDGKEREIIAEVREQVNKFKNIIDDLPFKMD
jgi:20S proteasome alpha/beta subunit